MGIEVREDGMVFVPKELVDWSTLPVDTLVVLNYGSGIFYRYLNLRVSNRLVRCFSEGKTSKEVSACVNWDMEDDVVGILLPKPEGAVDTTPVDEIPTGELTELAKEAEDKLHTYKKELAERYADQLNSIVKELKDIGIKMFDPCDEDYVFEEQSFRVTPELNIVVVTLEDEED